MANLMDNKVVKKKGEHRNYTQRPSGHSRLNTKVANKRKKKKKNFSSDPVTKKKKKLVIQ